MKWINENLLICYIISVIIMFIIYTLTNKNRGERRRALPFNILMSLGSFIIASIALILYITIITSENIRDKRDRKRDREIEHGDIEDNIPEWER